MHASFPGEEIVARSCPGLTTSSREHVVVEKLALFTFTIPVVGKNHENTIPGYLER